MSRQPIALPRGASECRPTPRSTLVVPVHRGREAHLAVLLRSIAAAPSDAGPWYPSVILLVTNDLADIDETMRRVVPQLEIPLETLFVPGATTVAALRNRAADHVTTEWMHFMDSDTEAPPGYFT